MLIKQSKLVFVHAKTFVGNMLLKHSLVSASCCTPLTLADLPWRSSLQQTVERSVGESTHWRNTSTVACLLAPAELPAPSACHPRTYPLSLPIHTPPRTPAPAPAHAS